MMSPTLNTSTKGTQRRDSNGNRGKNCGVTSLQVLLAYKVIGLVDNLSSAEKRVAIAIIDHLNRRTGRCEPSLERLAEILEINVKTVKDAVKKLDQLQIILKESFAGKYHCNAYQPNWHLLQTIDENWRKVMRDGPNKTSSEEAEARAEGKQAEKASDEVHETVVKTPLTTSPFDPFEGGEMTPQTNINNQFKEPVSARAKDQSPSDGDALEAVRENTRLGDLSRFIEVARHPSTRDDPKARMNAAVNSAEKRLWRDVMSQEAAFVLRVTEKSSPEHNDKAIEEEMKRRGGGLEYYRELLRSSVGQRE